MGAWGIGAFENDAALDWVSDLEAEGVHSITGALSLEDADDYLDVDVGCEGIAAAEVVAAARDGDAGTLPEPVREWLDANAGSITSDHVQAAAKFLARVLDDDSEIAELFAEGPDAAAWRDEVEALLARLAPQTS